MGLVQLPDWVQKPKFFCLICGLGFYDDEKARYERHAGKCAAKHAEAIEGASPRHGLLDDDFEHDVELEEWVRGS